MSIIGAAQQQDRNRVAGIDPALFAFTVNTATAAVSASGSFTIPSANTGAYNYSWTEVNGSGTGSGTSSGASHTVVTGVTPGLIKMFIHPTAGLFDKFVFAGGGDRLKMKSIEQWGTTPWSVLQGSYYNCTNMTGVTAIDAPITSVATNTRDMFRACTSMTSINNLGNWSMSSVTTAREMFRDCTILSLESQDIGKWTISSMLTLQLVAHNVTISSAAYDKILIGYAGQSVQSAVLFGPNSTTKHTSAATAARATLTGAPNNWVISDGGLAP